MLRKPATVPRRNRQGRSLPILRRKVAISRSRCAQTDSQEGERRSGPIRRHVRVKLVTDKGQSSTVRYTFMDEIVIRLANDSDLPSLGRLGALLLETHYRFDHKRFMAPHPNSADGYAWFLRSQLREKDVVVFVAERAGAIVGYVYAGLEPTSWKEL